LYGSPWSVSVAHGKAMQNFESDGTGIIEVLVNVK
jgi:hypothetical protein